MSERGDLCGRRWSTDEDAQLKHFISVHYPDERDINWELATTIFSNKRSAVHCRNRWEQVLKKGLTRGPWTKEEDDVILSCIASGMTQWRDIALCVGNRIGKQCRERWDNHLDPELSKAPWTVEEEARLISAQIRLGNKWTKIAREMPGRSENDVKNHWHSLAFRKKYPEFDKKRKPGPSFEMLCDTNLRRTSSSMTIDEPRAVSSPSPDASDVKTFEEYVSLSGLHGKSHSEGFDDMERLTSGSPFDLTPISLNSRFSSSTSVVNSNRMNSSSSIASGPFWDFITSSNSLTTKK